MDWVSLVFYTTSEYPHEYVFEVSDCRYDLGTLYVETTKGYEKFQSLLDDPETNPDDVRMVVVGRSQKVW